MKTIVCYYSKYGSTKAIAERIAQSLACPCVNSTQGIPLDVEQVIFVCATYMGRIHKTIRQSLHTCDAKRIIFIKTGLQTREHEKELEQNLQADYAKVTQSYAIGGKLQMKRITRFEKGIIRMVDKQMKFMQHLDANQECNLFDEALIQQLIIDIS